MKPAHRASLAAVPVALLLALVPASASAETVTVTLANMEIDNAAGTRTVYVRVVETGSVCGSAAGGPTGVLLRWRQVESGATRVNYDEGFSALLSALVGRLRVQMNVSSDLKAAQCIIDRITLLAP